MASGETKNWRRRFAATWNNSAYCGVPVCHSWVRRYSSDIAAPMPFSFSHQEFHFGTQIASFRKQLELWWKFPGDLPSRRLSTPTRISGHACPYPKGTTINPCPIGDAEEGKFMYRMKLVCLLTLLFASSAIHAQGCSSGLCTFANLDDLSRLQWQHCTDSGCAGGNGLAVAGVANTTETPPYTFTVDGQSLRFDLDFSGSGCTSNCFSNALFFNDPSGTPSADTDAATKITIDLYAGLDPTGINGSQALEFNVFQAFCNPGPCPSGTFYVFTYSYQCDFDGGFWRVWGSANGAAETWHATTVPCNRFSNTNPNGASFNHFTFNFTRGSNLSTPTITYTDFWVNGNHYVLNVSYGVLTRSQAGHYFEPSIQLDGNASGTSYSLWTDQWTVTASN